MVCLFSYQVVGLTAEVHKQLETNGGLFTSINDIGHVRGKHERKSPKTFNQATVFLQPKQQEDPTNKKSYRPTSLMDIGANVLSKTLTI